VSPDAEASTRASHPDQSGPSSPQGGPSGGQPISASANARNDRRSAPRKVVLIVFAIVAVVIVVLALLLFGVLTPAKSASTVTSTTFRPAWAEANSTANGVNGGAWELVSAVGYDSPSSLTLGIGNFTGTCALSPVANNSPPTTVNLPAFSGKPSSGSSPFWILAYEQLFSADILLLAIVDGAAVPLGEETAFCFDPSNALLVIPEGAVDSSTVAPIAGAAGGAEYLATHPNVLLEMSLLGGLPGGPQVNPGPYWNFVYSPCDPFGSDGPSGLQAALDIELSALNGTILALGNTTVNCDSSSAGTELSSSLSLAYPGGSGPSPNGVAGECGPNDWCYEVGFEAVGNNLTASDIQIQMTTDTGLLLTLGAIYIDGGNSSQGYLTGGAGANPSSPWVTGNGTITPTTTLTFGDHIWIDFSPMDPNGDGYLLTVTGFGAFSGSVSITLP
jgi:hypothetical protein